MGLGPRASIWTDAHDSELRDLCTGKKIVGEKAWYPIAEHFEGRTPAACRQRWQFLRALDAGKAPRERNLARATRWRRSQKQIRLDAQAKLAMQKPLARPPLPSSITAFVFGDPLPGRSALDLRRQSTSTNGENHASHH